jgi:hypothetical protein
MVPVYRSDELEQSNSATAMAVEFGVLAPAIVTTDGSEETVFDMYEDARDYDLGEGD